MAKEKKVPVSELIRSLNSLISFIGEEEGANLRVEMGYMAGDAPLEYGGDIPEDPSELRRKLFEERRFLIQQWRLSLRNIRRKLEEFRIDLLDE